VTDEERTELARLRLVAKWARQVSDQLHDRGWISELDTPALNLRAALGLSGGRSHPADGS
jgi:hypothetical protein